MAFESQAGFCILSNHTILNILDKYKLGIHFAEHNFGSLGRILFILVLFEREFKTLFGMLFLSLYLENCIFYYGISISGLIVN